MSYSTQFYSKLDIHQCSINELLDMDEVFHQFPEDWHIVITDIKQSTKAVGEGLHELVNLIATGSIIAVLNLARDSGIEVPFFFGGDGATILIPESLLQSTMVSLKEHQQNALRDFDLQLRVGSVAVKDIYNENYSLQIARLNIYETLIIPIILGKGLARAEEIIKNQPLTFAQRSGSNLHLNLAGMECRWDKVRPPENKNEVVCLLVVNQDQADQRIVYKKVFDLINEIYGAPEIRSPISVSRLSLKASLDKIQREMQVKLGKFNTFYLIGNWLVTLFGKTIFPRTPNGKKYMQMLVELADTLVMDGRLNTVMSGTTDQCRQLTQALDKLEEEGQLLYGFHVSQASIMSCYVRDRYDKHIHFIDGSDGGYTQAARMLKRKMKAYSA